MKKENLTNWCHIQTHVFPTLFVPNQITSLSPLFWNRHSAWRFNGHRLFGAVLPEERRRHRGEGHAGGLGQAAAVRHLRRLLWRWRWGGHGPRRGMERVGKLLQKREKHDWNIQLCLSLMIDSGTCVLLGFLFEDFCIKQPAKTRWPWFFRTRLSYSAESRWDIRPPVRTDVQPKTFTSQTSNWGANSRETSSWSMSRNTWNVTLLQKAFQERPCQCGVQPRRHLQPEGDGSDPSDGFIFIHKLIMI